MMRKRKKLKNHLRIMIIKNKIKMIRKRRKKKKLMFKKRKNEDSIGYYFIKMVSFWITNS